MLSFFYNHATYCLFELVSIAKQENLSWSNVAFILRELQLLVRSRAFCRVSSKIKKYNFEIKKSSRRTILVRAIALHGKFFRWAAVSTEYDPSMQISKSTRHALDLHSKMSSKCDVTLELYRTIFLKYAFWSFHKLSLYLSFGLEGLLPNI